MSGNLCRCTGYVGIIRAIQSVIADRRARGIAAVPGAGRTVLGPAGSGHGQAVAARAAAARRIRGARSRFRLPAAKSLADWKPQASFEQSFTVNHSVERGVEFLC